MQHGDDPGSEHELALGRGRGGEPEENASTPIGAGGGLEREGRGCLEREGRGWSGGRGFDGAGYGYGAYSESDDG